MPYPVVLVTGCGGDIGCGIGRIFKMSGICKKAIGCDILDEHSGIFVFDECDTVKRVDSQDYEQSVADVVKRHSIGLIIPASEPELRYLLSRGLPASFAGVPIITASKTAMEVGFDKLATARFLASAGLNSPWTKVVGDGMPEEYPCIIKSRFGAGGKDFMMVDDEDIARYLSRKRPGDIWQEYLGPDNEEYTCGLYRTNADEVRTIVINRQLRNGSTYSGHVAFVPSIEADLVKLAKALDLKGSINVQLRLTKKGPVVFEINPRFSSTLVFRHMMGFQDVVWSIREMSGKSIGEYKAPPTGTAIYRLTQEAVAPPREYSV